MEVKCAWIILLISVNCLLTVVNCNNQLSDLFYTEIRELLSEREQEAAAAAAAANSQVFLHPVQVQGWPRPLPHLGQVTGVAVNTYHQPVIFHRGPRVWDETSFNDTNHFQHVSQGPIAVDTLLTLDPDTGEIIGSWGSHFFYMPHGLTIDKYGYYYMTDVALHQVFKFKPTSKTPSLVFGQRFQPGSGTHHLCKPTDVAVATTGEIFIADGYCNSRILKHDPNGNLLRVIPQNPGQLSLRVPHSITLLESLDLLCVADRENMRVVCPRAGLRRSINDARTSLTIQQPDLGRIFAVTSHGEKLFAVNGPTMSVIPVRGLTMDPVTERVIDQWGPIEQFTYPHDLEVCHNTSSLYVVEIGPNRVWKFLLNKIY